MAWRANYTWMIIAALVAACEKAPPPAQTATPQPGTAPAGAPTAAAPASVPPPGTPAGAPVASGPPAAAVPAGVPKSAPNAPVIAGNVALTPSPKVVAMNVPAAALPPSAAKAAVAPVNFIGTMALLPTDWQATPPTNSMRVAQYVPPALPGAEPAEMVVFYFAPGRGGTQDENITRWASQFLDANGKPVKAMVARTEVNGMPVTRVELAGGYSRGVAMGSGPQVKPDQVLLAAIVTTPAQANVTLHFFGPKSEVSRYRASFEEIVASLRPSGH